MTRLALVTMAYVLGYESGNPQRIVGVVIIAALVAALCLSKEVSR